jgi:hypothetical protein
MALVTILTVLVWIVNVATIVHATTLSKFDVVQIDLSRSEKNGLIIFEIAL